MTAQPDITPLTGTDWNVSAWTVTLIVRGASRHLSPDCLEPLAFLEPTVEAAAQPNRRIITLIVNATSAATALDYGRRRTGQALAAAHPTWRIVAPGQALRLDARSDAADVDRLPAAEIGLAHPSDRDRQEQWPHRLMPMADL